MRLLYGLIAIMLSVALCQAANIKPVETPECKIRLDGEIKRGDFAAFLAIAATTLKGEQGESTAKDVICLNSPGGSLSEGALFAQYFYKNGVGTSIGDSDQCYSVCAVMFMMGVAKGAEVSFVNRRLHILGSLGFHRPYLDIAEEGLIEKKALSVAYDAAFESALDLLAIANSKAPWSNEAMLPSDLLQSMLKHIGADLFLIDTVDKAGRWKIEIFGYQVPKSLTPDRAFYVCENSLQWQIATTDEDITFERFAIGNLNIVQTTTSEGGEDIFVVTGLASGYAYEGCIVASGKAGLSACGADEYSSTTLGDGMCGVEDFERKLTSNISPLAMFNPRRTLASLGKPETGATLRCIVIRAGIAVDDELCALEWQLQAKKQIVKFTWASGAQTVLTYADGNFTINGSATARETSPIFGDCFQNPVTGNDFCYRPG